MNIQTVSGKVFATNNEQKSPVFLSVEALHEWLETPQGKEFQGKEVEAEEEPEEKPKRVVHKKKKEN